MFFSFSGYATFSNRYSFDQIPDNLKVGADAVVRTEQMVVNVVQSDKVVIKYKLAITLLNENALEYRYPSVFYNKFIKISSLKGSVYDEKGKLIKALGSSSIFDLDAISAGDFYTDDRRKVLVFPLMKFPYTIEYEYELLLSSYLKFPTFIFQKNPDVSVQNAGIQYVIPNGVNVKFKDVNIDSKVDSISVKGKKIYTWLIENIPTVKYNNYVMAFSYRAPVLYAAPNEFVFDGYKGTNVSWKAFGTWNYKINEGRDVLSSKEISTIQDLVKDIATERDRIKAIYEYMQSKTRYVYIAYGLGGLQTMTAKQVEEKRYGDCKALSNYTMALLKAVGIKSHYTLVTAGANRNIIPTFVADFFNHIILCVPQPKDTIWLECTSQTLPFNYLSDFTSNRFALLISEEGGKLVRTPAFKKEDNILRQFGSIKFDFVANRAEVDLTTSIGGVFFGKYHDLFAGKKEEEIKRDLSTSLSFPTYNISSVKYSEDRGEKPTADLQYKLTSRGFFVKSSSRLFFQPSINKENFLLNESFMIDISESIIKTDSIDFIIPYGYVLEYIPSVKEINTKYGSFKYELVATSGKIIFKRKIELNKGRYPATQFNEFYSFINEVAAMDRERVILKKN